MINMATPQNRKMYISKSICCITTKTQVKMPQKSELALLSKE